MVKNILIIAKELIGVFLGLQRKEQEIKQYEYKLVDIFLLKENK